MSKSIIGLTEIGRAAMLRQGHEPPNDPKTDPNMPKVPFVNFVDPSLFDDLRGESGVVQQRKIRAFFLHLSICHTVIPETLDSGEVRLSASSPDEQALVAGASYFGFTFRSREVGRANVEIDRTLESFDMLEVLEFNSTRKRMSVIVRNEIGELFLYCKGKVVVLTRHVS